MALASDNVSVSAQSVRAGLSVRGLFGLLIVSLILSGISGLVYQVIWFRVLGLTFGVTVHATSAVLAAFMTGLAVGSMVAARYVDRLRRPLLTYGFVEIAIGAAGFFSLAAFDALQPLYRSLAMAFPNQETALSLIRFGLAFGIMIVPTTMMGATLPLVVRSSVLRLGKLSRNISLLYAANTFGAILGAFLAAFALIGSIGIVGAVTVAASINVLLGVLWVAVSWLGREDETVSLPDTHSEQAVEAELDPSHRQPDSVANAVLATYAVAGMIALAYEVVWTRLLVTIFPGTVYAFAIMLCAILTGIAVGSWAINRVIGSRQNWLLVFALMQGGIGLTALYSLVIIGQGYRILTWVQGLVGNTDPALVGEPWFMAAFALLCIFPSAFIMGLMFPVAAKLYGAGRREVAQRVGTIYGANTIGAIVGSLGAGLVLIPILGAQNTLWALAGANLLLGVGLLALTPGHITRRIAVTVGAFAVFGAALVWTPDVYQQLFATDPQNQATLWHHEGQDATVKVTIDLDGNRVIYTNSAGQNSDGRAEAVFHYQLGLLGPLLHPDPKLALVVGIGAGQTAGAAALHPGIHVTAIELLEGVVLAQPYFSHVNFDLLNRPNVTIVVNDGRNFLLTTNQKFDVIESDPIWPTHAGAANLYSADYYRLARAALKDDGIMVQWVDTSLPEHIYKMMVRAFYDVFPNATMWFHGSILVGSPGPLLIDRDTIDAKLVNESEMREVLYDLGLRSGNDVLREYVAGPFEVRQYLGDGPMLTDHFPYVEYARFTPTDGSRADLRWYRVANYVAAREQPGDAIVFSDAAVQKGFRAFHRTGLAAYMPNASVVGRESEVAAQLTELFTQHERVWFIPWWNTDSDVFIERWLNNNSYQVVNKPLGNLRVLQYVRASDEPSLNAFSIDFGSSLRLARSGAPAEAQVGDVARLPIEWVARQDIREDYKVVVRLVDDRGRVFASFDRMPRAAPTTGWRSGHTVIDRAGLLIPPGTPPGVYRLDVDVYRAVSGERLAPINPNAPGQRVVIGSLRVLPTARTFKPEAVEATTISYATFGDSLRLAGTTVAGGPRRPGDPIPFSLYLQALSSGERSGAVLLGDPNRPIASSPVTLVSAEARPGAIERVDGVLRVPPSTSPGRYDLWLRVSGPSGRAEWLGRLNVVAAPPLPTPAAPAQLVNAQFGDVAVLEGATVRSNGGGTTVTLVWRALRETDRSFAVFVHALDANGQIVAQADGIPAEGLAPTTAWTAGLRLEDTRRLGVAKPDGGRIVVGLYDTETGARAPVGGFDSVTLP